MPTRSSRAAPSRSPTFPSCTRSASARSWSTRARRGARRPRRGAREARPRDLRPVTPAIAEPSTGETMGQSAEKMAKENGITREAQDRFALRVHQRAAAGTADGRLTAEIAPCRAAGMRASGDKRQRHPHRHVARGARHAQAGVRQAIRLGDGGQLVAAHRRRGGRAADERGEGEGARLRAARATSGATPYAALDPGWQLLRGPRSPCRRRSSAPACAGATSTSSRCTRRSPRRCSRTCRRGPRATWAERARASPARWARWTGAHQRHGRVDRDRTSVRRDRRALRHDARQRDAPPRRAVRPDLRLRAGGMGFAMVLERE